MMRRYITSTSMHVTKRSWKAYLTHACHSQGYHFHELYFCKSSKPFNVHKEAKSHAYKFSSGPPDISSNLQKDHQHFHMAETTKVIGLFAVKITQPFKENG